ncbi:MAG: MgtC/SapB family protein [Terracidiphilus sp.]|nr:MgtC/SapB family protein [Terracidiphilus sp.]
MLDTSYFAHTLHASTANTVADVIVRLAVAAALGGIVGIERQIKHRPAGLRTNMFMCFGAALFTIVSGLMSSGAEDTRIAAQIVTGIGFIGAGVIMRTGASVQGVTTAATIFVVAAIGMCCGCGLMFPAVLATGLVVFGLFFLGMVEQHVFGNLRMVLYQLEAPTSADVHALLADALSQSRSRLVSMKIDNRPDSVAAEFLFEAREATQTALQNKLRQELDAKQVLSYHLTVQE